MSENESEWGFSSRLEWGVGWMAEDRLGYETELFTDEENGNPANLGREDKKTEAEAGGVRPEAEAGGVQALSFEAGIGTLEQIVKALEQRDVPLENALTLFKEGIGLVHHCTSLLDEAEHEMQMLLEEDGKLQVKTAAFPLEG